MFDVVVFKPASDRPGGGAGSALEKRERPVLGVWSEVVFIIERSSEVDRHEGGEVGCVVPSPVLRRSC